MTDEDIKKSEQLHNTINDFRSDKDRNAIFEKHYGNIDTNIGVKGYIEKDINGSYDPYTNTIFTNREKMSYLDNGLMNIKDGKPLDENQTLAIKDYGHEGTHYWQKNLDKLTNDNPIERKILEAFTEMEAQKVTINYLEEACKGTRGNPDFREIIEKSKTYQNTIKGIDDFCNDYGINKPRVMDEFKKRTREDNFNPNKSSKTLLEIVNKGRDKEIEPEDLKKYISED